MYDSMTALQGGAVEGRRGGSSWGLRVTRRWAVREGSAPPRSLAASGLLGRASTSTSPSTGQRVKMEALASMYVGISLSM